MLFRSMLIEALEKKLVLYERDAARVEPQSMQGIKLELLGRRVEGPDAVGDALRAAVKSVKEDVRASHRTVERIVGRFGGFELGIRAGRGEEVPQFYCRAVACTTLSRIKPDRRW